MCWFSCFANCNFSWMNENGQKNCKDNLPWLLKIYANNVIISKCAYILYCVVFILLFFYLIFFVKGNPLICDCELLWYKQWLAKKVGTHEAAREIALKTHCWTRKPNHEYSIVKVSNMHTNIWIHMHVICMYVYR